MASWFRMATWTSRVAVLVAILTCSLAWTSLRPAQSDKAQQLQSRRGALAAAVSAGAILPDSPAKAAQEGELDDFSLQLLGKWKVKKELHQAIRVRREVVLDAFDPATGATVVVTRTPLSPDGLEAAQRERLFSLAGAFDDSKRSSNSKDDLVKLLTASFDIPDDRRDRGWLQVARLPDSEEFDCPTGQRFVRFGYDVLECKGEILVYENSRGELEDDCDGQRLPVRRHIASATVLPTKFTSMRNSYTDNSRFIEALWLLDASVPLDAATPEVTQNLVELARTFSVKRPKFQLVEG